MDSHRHTQAYRASTVYDWCRITGSSYLTLLPQRTGLIYEPHWGPLPGVGNTIPLVLPEAYIATIEHGSVIGGQSFVLAEDSILCDTAFSPHADRYRLDTPNTTWHDQTATVMSYRTDGEIPEGIHFQTWYGANYHHWIVEHLCKFLLLEMANVPASVPLLVEESVLSTPNLGDALATVDKLHRPVIPLRNGYEYRVAKLIVPSDLLETGPDLKNGLVIEPGDVTIAKEAVEFLRGRLVPNVRGRRRVWIDRQESPVVRLLNGPDVKRVFREFGFESINPGSMTFAEQQHVFGQVEYIAGESGAGLTNILLAPPNAVMIVLQAQAWPTSIYSDLCANGNQRSLFIVGTETHNQTGLTYQAQFVIDTSKLRSTLKAIFE